jgi:hypothetical protein
MTINNGIVLLSFLLSAGVSMTAHATPQQAQCQQEAAQLNQQLSQCSTNACRQQVQAAIAAHNARCSNAH